MQYRQVATLKPGDKLRRDGKSVAIQSLAYRNGQDGRPTEIIQHPSLTVAVAVEVTLADGFTILMHPRESLLVT